MTKGRLKAGKVCRWAGKRCVHDL